MVFITGSAVVWQQSIKVEFSDDDVGTILARTCSNLIVFPRGGIFLEEADPLGHFSIVMRSMTAGKGLKFNTV